MGGFLITAIYCGYKIRKGKSLALFTSKGSVKIWGFTFIMGLMWFGGVALYGTAVMNLGELGASIGWALIQSMAVISGSIVGIIAGEWKGTGRQPLTIMLLGLTFLIGGMLVISKAGTL